MQKALYRAITVKEMTMRLAVVFVFSLLTLPWPAAVAEGAIGQDPRADAAFKAGNELMAQHKPADALLRYKESLAIEPNDTSVLFNAGLAGVAMGDYSSANDFWKRVKALDPGDWRTRAKLVQSYQALGKMPERDRERSELFALRKSGESEELTKADEYCRDQFAVNGVKVMAFELFELKGDRALRYVFSVLNSEENREAYRISLGSYDLTNNIWHETTKPKPRPNERLFHLDGYYPSSHATYAMYAPEPSYDEVRAKVVSILKGESKPVSSTTYAPATGNDAKKPQF